MTGKLNWWKVSLTLLVALAVCSFGADRVSAADWPDILKQLKSTQESFQGEIKDMTLAQEIKMDTPNGEMTQEMKLFRKGDKYRWENKMQGGQMSGSMETTVIYDGKDTWMISPFTGKKKMNDNEQKQYQGQRDWWNQFSDKTAITGSETVGGRDCYVVAVNDPQKSSFTRIWVDKKSLNFIKGEIKNSKGEISEMINSDFRKIKGDREMPYKMEMFTKGKLLSSATVKSVEINKGLPDDLFSAEKIQAKGMDFKSIMKGLPIPQGK
ncbi:MAG: outer membrane lipoprotein-sorting protein [bacterium]|nr:outer membrane lipoprotein-sorting protein [bacterium]